MIEIVKKIIPKELKRELIKFKVVRFMYGMINGENKLIRERIKLNKELEKKLKGKTKLKVAFFVLTDSVWKMDNLYLEMEKDKCFEPIIIICPWVNLGKEKMEYEMNKTEKFFKEKNYNYIKTIKKNGEYLDVEQEIKPDIIFYTNPYRGLIDDRYYITNIKNTLCCYIPYAFDISNLYIALYDSLFQNILWKFFLPTKLHYSYAKKYSRIGGKNVYITRYPILEIFYKTKYSRIINTKSKKIIIWAPHHTINGSNVNLEWSTFEKYYNFMLYISQKYKNEIKLIFKPHPILYDKLKQEWGEEKVNKYYGLWSNNEERGIELGDYKNIFYESDGIIHDSGSFTVEYLYFKKPACKLMNKKEYLDTLNSFGREALNCHKLAYKKREIIEFINEIINGSSKKIKEMEKFHEEYLKLTNNTLPSKQILKLIKEYL